MRLQGWINAYYEGTSMGGEAQDRNETQMDGSVARDYRRKPGCLAREGRVRGKEKQRRKEKQEEKIHGKKTMDGQEGWRDSKVG